ncbi:MAG: hypothetical protein KAG53_03920 [Endozoicomonadaceae bacterium]|nr:hypothetical protein [Endozoicomonadaceae bacterium]
MLIDSSNQPSTTVVKENSLPDDTIEQLGSVSITPMKRNSSSSHSISECASANEPLTNNSELSPYQNKEYRNLEKYTTQKIPVYTPYVSAHPILASNIFIDLKESNDFEKTVTSLQKNDTLSTPCFINTTCYNETNEVIKPTNENFKLVKIVKGLLIYPGAYMAVKYYLLGQQYATQEIISQRQDLYKAILLAHRNQKHARATNPQHTLTYFGNQLCINGLNNSIAFAPFEEPFNDYLEILTNQTRPFSNNYDTSDLITDFSKTNENKKKTLHTLCTLVFDSDSQANHLTPTLDTTHVCLFFDDPVMLKELLSGNNRSTSSYVAPLCIYYDNIRFKLLLFTSHSRK